MKNLNVMRALFTLSLIWAVFVISGCKKEAAIKPIATTTVGETVDSAVFFKGYLGTEYVRFEGNAISYNSYGDPDSSAEGHSGNGHGDNDAYYLSGSKWVTLSGAGLTISNASVELRSLAVRVFVSPVAVSSTNYYNLLGPAAYSFTTNNNPGKGAFVTVHDKNGMLWTSNGDQTGSTLTIISRGPNMTTYTMVSGTISCKMYDTLGNVKMLNGATFTAALGL